MTNEKTLVNGYYRIQCPTGKADEVLLFSPTGDLLGKIKRISINVEKNTPDVQGIIETADGTKYRLLRVQFSAKGILIDGKPKKGPLRAQPEHGLSLIKSR